jgi:hypothetical protein
VYGLSLLAILTFLISFNLVAWLTQQLESLNLTEHTLHKSGEVVEGLE